jgi:hypothetical protein
MIKPGSTISHFFYVRSLSNRILTPDANPSGVLIRGAVDTSVTVTITSASDGGFIASMAIPSDWTEGERVYLRVSAVWQSYPMSTTHYLGDVSTVLATLKATKNLVIAGL